MDMGRNCRCIISSIGRRRGMHGIHIDNRSSLSMYTFLPSNKFVLGPVVKDIERQILTTQRPRPARIAIPDA